MKNLITIIFFIFSAQGVFAQNNAAANNKLDSTKKVYTVSASCGQCQFKMKGKGCSLAVKFKGKNYFVDGTTIDDHGDAHATDGFCEAIKQAEVQGKVKKNRFVVSYFKLIVPTVQ